jgi:hypothetical protein
MIPSERIDFIFAQLSFPPMASMCLATISSVVCANELKDEQAIAIAVMNNFVIVVLFNLY